MDDVVTWPELVLHAGSEGRARALVRQRRVWRVFGGVYAPAWAPDTPSTRARAARRVLPEHAALSHRAALHVAGVPVLDEAEGAVLDATSPPGLGLAARAGLRTHVASLPEQELVDHDGLLLTSAARAVVDVARTEPLLDAVAAGDAALRAGATTPLLVAEALERSAGRPGVEQARAAVALLDGRSESVLESRVRVRLVLAGLQPEPQVDLYDAVGRHLGRVDLLVDGAVVEADGLASRTSRSRFDGDRSRQNGLVVDAGLVVVRVVWADTSAGSAAALADRVRRAARRAAASPAPEARRGPSTLPAPRRRPLPTRADAVPAGG